MTSKIRIPPLSIIVVVDEDGGFGKSGKIPWNIPEDLAHFKDITSGGVCLMGRRTYEDIYAMAIARKQKKAKEINVMGSPPSTNNNKKTIVTPILPGRESFVITSDENYVAHGATVSKRIINAVQSLDENDNRNIFIIGGYRMFIEGLSWTNTIYMTIVKNKRFGCDKFFPIEVINKHYKIVDGTETDKLYFLTYKRG